MLFLSHVKYSRAYSERGLARYQLGELSRAIDDFDQAIILDSSNFLAFEGRAVARLDLGNWQDAMKDLDD